LAEAKVDKFSSGKFTTKFFKEPAERGFNIEQVKDKRKSFILYDQSNHDAY
jgi:hypothetical protein